MAFEADDKFEYDLSTHHVTSITTHIHARTESQAAIIYEVGAMGEMLHYTDDLRIMRFTRLGVYSPLSMAAWVSGELGGGLPPEGAGIEP